MKFKAYQKSVIILFAVIVLLVIPGFFPSFCDWYTDNIYKGLCDAITFLTSKVPFAVGEIVMYIGIALLVPAVVFAVLLIFLRKKDAFRKVTVKYYKIISIVLLSVILVYMITWYIPFRGTVLGKGNPERRTQYSYEEIEELLFYIIDNGNAAAEEIVIAEDGSIAFHTAEENLKLASEAMAALGDEYGRLKGYYPPVKEAICSDIINRMNIGGYNYPFTMEPTRNRYIDPLYLPTLEAHELAHHKGYYKENEANFLSQIALSKTSDPYLRLSAYRDMYRYVIADYREARDAEIDRMIEAGEITDWPEDPESPEGIEKKKKIIEEKFGPDPEFSEREKEIAEASMEEERKLYAADSHIIDELPFVDRMIHDAADTGWSTQGKILKDNSYDGVVLLLLQYYYGEF